MRKTLLLIICAGLLLFAQKESSVTDMTAWIGTYSFDEFVSPNIALQYRIEVFDLDNRYFANISIDGFQTLTRIRSTVVAKGGAIYFQFDSYLPEHKFQTFENGERLLTLKYDEQDLITEWGKISPVLPENEQEGGYFLKFID